MKRWGHWAVLVALAVLPCLGCAETQLRFRRDGTFKLVQLTDMHLGEGELQDSHTLEVVRDVLEAERPDLVVLSGDMVSGFRFPSANLAGRLGRLLRGPASWYEQQWRPLAALLQAAGIPYASILGNHDGEGDLGRRQILEMDVATGGGLSLSQPGPAHLPGAGNYWLDILEPEGQRVAGRVWMLDSMNRGCGDQAQGWGCVPAETVEWVRQQAEQLPRVPSLAYVHIPLPQMMAAWSGAANGSRVELVGCPMADTGLFDVAKELGIHAIYSGHDHHNDFSGSVGGVRLAYGRKSGHGSYGPSAGLLHGARVVELEMGQDTAHSKTWIRQEGGSLQFQPAAKEPEKYTQHICPLHETSCDKLLGLQLCSFLRGARHTLTLIASLTACTTVFAATIVIASRAHRQWRLRDWQEVATAEPVPV